MKVHLDRGMRRRDERASRRLLKRGGARRYWAPTRAPISARLDAPRATSVLDVRKASTPRASTAPTSVVCGNAVRRRTNVEATAARERGLRTVSFPQALEELFPRDAEAAGRRRRAARAKTTSSSMLAWVLRQTGKDPAISSAARRATSGSNATLGTGAVVRSSKLRRSTTPPTATRRAKFLHYRPGGPAGRAIELRPRGHLSRPRSREGRVPEAARAARAGRAADRVRRLPQGSRRPRRWRRRRALRRRSREHPARGPTWPTTGGCASPCARTARRRSTLRLRRPVRSTRATRSASCWCARVSGRLADAAAALAEFHGVARRQEVVGEGRGVTRDRRLRASPDGGRRDRSRRCGSAIPDGGSAPSSSRARTPSPPRVFQREVRAGRSRRAD